MNHVYLMKTVQPIFKKDGTLSHHMESVMVHRERPKAITQLEYEVKFYGFEPKTPLIDKFEHYSVNYEKDGSFFHFSVIMTKVYQDG